MKKEQYNYVSPDGITIRDEDFKSRRAATEYFKQWLKRFEMQGYYSSNRGRIPLTELTLSCKLITI